MAEYIGAYDLTVFNVRRSLCSEQYARQVRCSGFFAAYSELVSVLPLYADPGGNEVGENDPQEIAGSRRIASSSGRYIGGWYDSEWLLLLLRVSLRIKLGLA